MNGAFEIAGVGLVSQQQALDAIASNIANINTPGFKRSDVRFSEMLSRHADAASPRGDLSTSSALAGVGVTILLALNEQGGIEPTARPLDLAIVGDGFIELMGPRGQNLLWRGGTLSIQEDGLLAGADGLALRAMINVPETATGLSIDSEGIVRATTGDGEAPIELGRIALVQIHDPSQVERLDGGVYRLAEGARVEEFHQGDARAGAFVQGALERSNVEINEEMVRLMIVQRAYAANAQLVQAADQMMAIANGLRK
ncbi:MAG: flagellar hook-basal body protein [Phycisphaerales bacterium]|nr:flagellar hook-basal body protein [Hyphomonadaceae bacterium]